MPVSSSRGRDFGNIPEKADTTGLQNLLQSSRGRIMGQGQKSRSMKEHATGVSEGGDRLSVREHGFHAAGFCPSLSGRGSQWPGQASYPQDESRCSFIHLVDRKWGKAKSEVGTCLKETVGARALVKREGPARC